MQAIIYVMALLKQIFFFIYFILFIIYNKCITFQFIDDKHVNIFEPQNNHKKKAAYER